MLSPLLYLHKILFFSLFFFFPFYSILFHDKDFVGISSANPHVTLLRPLEGSWGFKGLVAYAKYNRDSYESKLGISFSYFSVSF